MFCAAPLGFFLLTTPKSYMVSALGMGSYVFYVHANLIYYQRSPAMGADAACYRYAVSCDDLDLGVMILAGRTCLLERSSI